MIFIQGAPGDGGPTGRKGPPGPPGGDGDPGDRGLDGAAVGPFFLSEIFTHTVILGNTY